MSFLSIFPLIGRSGTLGSLFKRLHHHHSVYNNKLQIKNICVKTWTSAKNSNENQQKRTNHKRVLSHFCVGVIQAWQKLMPSSLMVKATFEQAQKLRKRQQRSATYRKAQWGRPSGHPVTPGEAGCWQGEGGRAPAVVYLGRGLWRSQCAVTECTFHACRSSRTNQNLE